MINKIARPLVMPGQVAVVVGVPICLVEAEFSELANKEETKMKNLVKSLGVVLILASSLQMAAAAPTHHQSRAQNATVHQQRSNADAYASWPAGQPDVYQSGPAYSGGFSAPAGR